MLENPDISIIIVTWNSEHEIGKCLLSIIENGKDLNYEIIVIDNNSSDRTVSIQKEINEKFFHRIKIIVNESNLGFTKACNQGIKTSSGKNILLLNPDTELTGSSLQSLLKKLNESEAIGAIAPQLLNEDGSIQKSCRNFPGYFDMFCEFSLLSYVFRNSHIFGRWKMNYFSNDEETEVKQPMAAALMIKKSVMSRIENFDERFKMFFNDVDLCKKIYDNGFRIIFYPGAKIFHKKGVSIYKDRERMIKIWNEDCLAYFKKYNYNFLLYGWLYVNLKISGILRILYYKLTK